MGRLIDGVWHDQWYDTKKTGGHFLRSEGQFRDWITADGANGFKAEAGRICEGVGQGRRYGEAEAEALMAAKERADELE
mgnify:CR=1 FL=1